MELCLSCTNPLIWGSESKFVGVKNIHINIISISSVKLLFKLTKQKSEKVFCLDEFNIIKKSIWSCYFCVIAVYCQYLEMLLKFFRMKMCLSCAGWQLSHTALYDPCDSHDGYKCISQLAAFNINNLLYMWPKIYDYNRHGIYTDIFCDSTDFWLTHWGRVTHICISSLTIIGSYYIMACRLVQCWNIVNWTPRNKLWWNVIWNSCIFIQ